jgi:hypothetical protein
MKVVNGTYVTLAEGRDEKSCDHHMFASVNDSCLRTLRGSSRWWSKWGSRWWISWWECCLGAVLQLTSYHVSDIMSKEQSLGMNHA